MDRTFLFADNECQRGVACRLHVVAEDLAKIVPRKGGALGIPTDITNPEDVAALAKEVLARFEDVDVVCNNAGVCLTGPFSATAAEDFRSQMDVVRTHMR